MKKCRFHLPIFDECQGMITNYIFVGKNETYFTLCEKHEDSGLKSLKSTYVNISIIKIKNKILSMI